MDLIQDVLLLCLAVALIAAFARRIPLPLPILLTIGGWGLSFLPALSDVRIDPAVFFLLFIPPLLFADAWLIPKRDFLRVLTPVLALALGLVAVTVVVVGYVVHWMIPSIPLAAAFALGAIVSPTDAVAVSAITEKLQVPSRVTNIINGESLINDASGLVAFKFAIAALATGTFSFVEMGKGFALLAVGGALLGLAVAWVISKLREWLSCAQLSEPMIQTTFSLLTPFAAYLAAEHLHLSGILAVVAAGIYTGWHDASHLDSETRRTAWETWSMLLFLFNGLVFLLLGIQLHTVFSGLAGQSWLLLSLYAGVVCAIVMSLRLAWVYLFAYLPLLWKMKWTEALEVRSPANVFLVGWAGIRGSVTLAAALSIPLVSSGTTPFPGRDLIIFLACAVIVVTLTLQGLTLPLVIRWCGISGDGMAEREERAARIETARAAIARVRSALSDETPALEQEVAARLIVEYETRVELLEAGEGDGLSSDSERRNSINQRLEAERGLRLAAISAERTELIRLRNGRQLNDESLRVIQRDLDNLEAGVRS